MMKERNLTFKQTVNAALRSALAPDRVPYTTPVRAMGPPRVNIDRALALSAALEDEAIQAELERRS